MPMEAEDRAGRAWSRPRPLAATPPYASLDDLPTRAACFAELARLVSTSTRASRRQALHLTSAVAG